MAVPVKIITERLNVVITRDYTIFLSIGSGSALTFDCSSNQILKGDILHGAWSPKSLSTNISSS
jgi:hypothetical protein